MSFACGNILCLNLVRQFGVGLGIAWNLSSTRVPSYYLVFPDLQKLYSNTYLG